MRKLSIMLIIVLCLALLATGITVSAADKTIIVGAKNFTEQYVLGNMMSILLEENGFNVREQFGTGSAITREGLESGQTDLYAEYTGTASLVYLGHEEVMTNPEALYEKVKNEDLEKNNIVWLDRSEINNTYAMAVREAHTEEIGTTLSDLANYVNNNPGEIIFGINHEFNERADGFWAMAEHYGMNVERGQVRVMDTGLTFEALNRNQIDVTMVFATDGNVKGYNLIVLEDDKYFFPVYNISVCVRKDVLEQYPEIEEIMKPIAELTDEIMQELNYQVDSLGLPEKLVARNFLAENGYLD